MPGDVETIIAKANTSEAVKARLMAEAGLDQPITTQFGIYLENLLTGDFGESFYTYDGSSNVLTIIAGRLPNTVILLLCAEVVAILLGLLIGVICAQKRGSKLDTGLLSGSLVHDLFFRHGGIVHAFQQDLTAFHLSFLRQQLADGECCGGLAASRLTHKTQALAVIQCKGYTVHRLRLTLGGGKICF